MDIKNAALLSSISGLLSKFISLLSVVLVARLLTPEEIGVFVIASSLTLIASEVRLLGINAYIVRERDLTQEKVSKCIGLAMLVSYSFAFALIAGASLLSDYYNNEHLQFLLLFLSVGFFAVPFIASTSAMLTKDYKIKQVLLIQNVGPLLGLVVTVALIQGDFSFYSLAVGQSVTALTTLCVSYIVRPSTMSWVPCFTDLKEVTRVGIYSSGTLMIQKLHTVVPDLFLGRTMGPAFTAIFSRAMGLQIFIQDILMTGISGIALPYLAKNSKDKSGLITAYFKAASLVNCFVLPPLVCAIVLSESLIFVMFGEQWGGAIFYAKMLGIWMVFRTFHQMTFPLLLTDRKEKVLFFSRVFIFAVFLSGCIVSSFTEPKTIPYVFIAVGALDFFVLISIVYRFFNVGLNAYVTSSAKSFFVAAVCGLYAYFLNDYVLVGLGHWTKLIVAGASLPVLWLLLVNVCKHMLADVITELLRQHVFNKWKKGVR